MAATDTPHAVHLLNRSRYQVNDTPRTILKSPYHTLIFHTRLEKYMAFPLVKESVPPIMGYDPGSQGDSAEARLPVQSALSPDRLSSLLPLHTQRTETDIPSANSHSNAPSAWQSAPSMACQHHRSNYPDCFLRLPAHVKNGLLFGLAGSTCGVIGLFCFTYVVLRGHAEQSWLRVSFPQSQDRRYGFWNGVASIVTLASTVD